MNTVQNTRLVTSYTTGDGVTLLVTVGGTVLLRRYSVQGLLQAVSAAVTVSQWHWVTSLALSGCATVTVVRGPGVAAGVALTVEVLNDLQL